MPFQRTRFAPLAAERATVRRRRASVRVDGYRRTREVADLPGLAGAIAWRDDRGDAILWLTPDDTRYPALTLRKPQSAVASQQLRKMAAVLLTSIYIDGNLFEMKQLDQAFAALADPTRRGIVVVLARGEASVSDLVGHFSLTQPTISSHIKVLESAGLISRRKVAQLRPCKLVPERLKVVTDWLERVQELWEGNFKRLDALLTQLKQAEKLERRK